MFFFGTDDAFNDTKRPLLDWMVAVAVATSI